MALQNISLDALSKVTLVDGNFIATDGGKETTLSFSRMLLHLGVHLLDNTRAAFNTQFAVAQEQVNAMTDLNAIMQLMTNYKNCFGKDGDVTDDIKTQNKNLFTSLERVTVNIGSLTDKELEKYGLAEFAKYYKELGKSGTMDGENSTTYNDGIEKTATLPPVTCYKTMDGKLIPILFNFEEPHTVGAFLAIERKYDVLRTLDDDAKKYAQLAVDEAKICELWATKKQVALSEALLEVNKYNNLTDVSLPSMEQVGKAYKAGMISAEQKALLDEYLPSYINITNEKSGLIVNVTVAGDHNYFSYADTKVNGKEYRGLIPKLRMPLSGELPNSIYADNYSSATWATYESILNEPLAPNGLTLGDTLKRQDELEKTSGGFGKNTLISSADMKKLEDFMKKYPTALSLDLKTLPVVNNEEISTLTANLQTAQSTLATLNEQQGMRVNQSMSKSSSMLQTLQTLLSTVQQTTQSAAGTGG